MSTSIAEPRIEATTRTRTALLAIFFFTVASNLRLALFKFPFFAEFYRSHPWQLGESVWKTLWIVLAIIGVMAAHRVRLRESLRQLGVARPFGFPFVAAFFATLPALVIFAALSPVNRNMSGWWLWMTGVMSPLSEEILFRAYLFQQLYRYAGWPFWAAALMNALPFAWGHINQADATVSSFVLVIGIAAVVAALAAWLLARWDYNVWFVVGLHSLMNFYWYVFAPEDTIVGGVVSNVARIVAIGLAVIITLRRDQFAKWLRVSRRSLSIDNQ